MKSKWNWLEFSGKPMFLNYAFISCRFSSLTQYGRVGVQFPRLGLSSALEKENAQLREEIAKLRIAADFSWLADHPVPTFIVSSKTGKILEVNQAALKLYRYDRKSLIERTLESLRATSSSGSYSRLDLVNPMGQSNTWAVKQLRRDGSVFTAEMMITPLTYRGMTAEMVQIWDVSRRVDAELGLRNIERRYHWLMDHATESIWRFELEVPIPIGLPVEEQIERCYRFGYLAEVSQSTAKMYGYPTSQAMVGMRLEAFMPRNQTNNDFLNTFIQNGYQIFDAVSSELDKKGNAKWFKNKLVGEVEAGLLVRAWGASLDITDRKQVEDHQKQSDQLWRDALNTVELLAMFLDRKGKATFINPYFTKLTGWSKEELLGEYLYDAIDGHEEKEPPSHITRTFDTKTGETLHIRWNNTVIYDNEGTLIGSFSLGEDVTEQLRSHQALLDSEDRYRQLVDELPVGLYRSTAEGQLAFANPVVLKLLGIPTQEEAAQVNLNQYAYGPDYRREEFLKHLNAEGVIHGMEYTWTIPGGEKLYVREHARAIKNEQGVVQYYEGTLEDITREKHANQLLAEREEQYRQLSQLAPIGIFMVSEGIVVQANQYLVEMLGYERTEEIVSKAMLEMFHPAEHNEMVLLTEGQGEGEWQFTLQERRMLKKDGSTLLVQGHVARTRVNDKPGVVIVARDISGERHAEQERRRWQQRILEMQKLESLGLLAGGLAHDFNNQLTVILGHTSLLQNQLAADSVHQSMLQPIEQAARHSTDLCQQMLSFAGRGRIRVTQVNMTELVKQSAGLIKIACARKAELEFDLKAELPSIQAEEAQIRQVLINLISNSAESFTSEQQGHITIKTGVMRVDENYQNVEVTLELPKGDYVYLDVIDDGSGMDVNTRRRIFEPFFTTKPAGRGLGLPAVLGIVRSHGGAIEVTSKLRHGTTFRVFLPLVRQVRQTVLPGDVPVTNRQIVPEGSTILIVDDEASLRSMTSQVLQKQGWKVLEAEDGVTACEALRIHSEVVQLVLIDLILPGQDGVEVLRDLWAIQPTLPAIAMSSYGSMELEQRFQGFPLRGILPKPFTPHSLVEAVEHVIGEAQSEVNEVIS